MESEWQKYAISDVMYIIGGGTPKRSISEYWNGDIPWLSVADFNTDDRHVSKTKETITDLGLQKSSTKLLDSGQLIISARGTVGALAQLDKPMTFNQSCYGLNAKTEYVTNDYLYYLVKKKVRDLQKITHGAVFDTITKDTFKDIEVQLPSLLTQKKIAHILSTLDDKIELNSKMNQTLEEMAQSIFKSWFVDFDPVHAKANLGSNADYDQIAKELGISREVLDLFPDGFEESELGMIPIGWKVKELGDFFPVVTGKKNANIATNDGKYIFFTCSQSASKTDVYSFDAAAILLAGNCDFNVKWYRGKFEAYQRTYVLIPRDIEFLSFLYFLISYKLSDITQSSQGSVVKFITKGMIENYKIALPNEIVLKDLVGIFSNINFKIEGNLEQIKTLQKTRDTLLPKLLSGELDVSELELDNVTH